MVTHVYDMIANQPQAIDLVAQLGWKGQEVCASAVSSLGMTRTMVRYTIKKLELRLDVPQGSFLLRLTLDLGSLCPLICNAFLFRAMGGPS